ncbi:hypothetical protein LOTGIDRAFT_158326 [Lottia gigantea]|uniref:Uncharacterized protein n=1 Tax=Lottia gigantea TaxID=225164 RepID=V4AYF1_LOTGI|nr:hypothetical protein LOTGIDRAFT_158326 [Lottia gigantea]ESP00096.1 hypothetical protein LOTGIDRAFT_158326 [Lottia gigantea]
MATSFHLQYLVICLLYVFSDFGCLSYDGRTVGPAIATVETKKDTVSIRLQRVTPSVLYKKFSNDIKGEIYSSNLEGTIKEAKRNGYSGLTFDYRNNMYYVIHTETDRAVGNILGFYASGNHEESPGPILLYSGLSPTVKCKFLSKTD